jgi:hypothetical protein
MNRIGKKWGLQIDSFELYKYGELSEQRIKYEILNYETSFFNMLE